MLFPATLTDELAAPMVDEDLDSVADRLDAATKSTAGGPVAEMADQLPDLLFEGGAKGIRTPDLLDANESRYQLRHSP